MTGKSSKHHLTTYAVVIMTVISVSPLNSIAFAFQDDTTSQPEDDINAQQNDGITNSADGNTISYGPAFFARFPNAVSALDIVRRIPAGAAIISVDGNADEGRGFSANQDRILINGRRVSGKSNDSQTTLSRIALSQVARIDVIRGSSPDIKVQSQESLINIVLNESAGQGSGTWEARMRMPRGKDPQFGGYLSYGNSAGQLDYFVSAEYAAGNDIIKRREQFFDGAGNLLQVVEDTFSRTSKPREFIANLAYNMDNGDQIRLNALYRTDNGGNRTPGTLFNVLPNGDLVELGDTFRRFRRVEDQYEIGADWETDLSDTLQLKLLGLYNRVEGQSLQFEDELITETPNINDFRFESDDLSTESIGRFSFVWTNAENQTLELGSEIAINTLDSDFIFYSRQGNQLLEVPVPVSDTKIRETRNESFAIHSWQVTPSLNVDTTLFTEWSEIKQTGDANKKRTFFFVRPNLDVRYNLTSNEQLQFAIRRNISQLDFGDFASSQTDDNQVAGGNADLVQEKEWRFEGTYERRLANDMGRTRLSLIYRDIEDRITQVEVAPGISGRGNVDSASFLTVRAEASIKLGFLGLPNFLIEPNIEYRDMGIRDPFTGMVRDRFNFRSKVVGEFNFRHDINSIGLSYGMNSGFYTEWKFFDIDEEIILRERYYMSLFVEKTLLAGLLFRFELFNPFDRQEGRDRLFYAAGRAGGVLTSRELRDARSGRSLRFALRGTF